MNTHPTTTATTTNPTREAAHPLTVAGPARRRWVLASTASVVLAGAVAPLLWVVGITSLDNVLVSAVGALATTAGLVVLGRWLRWTAWAQVPGAHARNVVRRHAPQVAALFTLARIAALAAGGVLIAQLASTPGTVGYLGLIGGLIAGVGLVLALRDLVHHRRITSTRNAVLGLIEAAVPTVWVLGTERMAWATLWFLVAASLTAVLVLGRVLVDTLAGRVERWWERRNAARRLA